MAADFTYDGTKIVVCNGTEGTPKTAAEIYDADLAGTRSLHDRDAVSAIDGAPVAVDQALQPADQLVLGGAVGNDLYFVITNWTNMVSANLYIIGTAPDGEARTINQTITGNETYYMYSFFKTVTHTQIWGFDKTDAGSFDYELIQGRWGVVWEFEENASYKFDCNVEIGNGTDLTYFQSKNELLYFVDGKYPPITANATFEMGDASGDWSYQGSVLSIALTVDAFLLNAAGTFKTYGSTIIHRPTGNKILKLDHGTWTARNTVISGKGGWSGQDLWLLGDLDVDWKDVRVLFIQGFRMYKVPVNFENVHVHDCTYALRPLVSVTVPNFKVTDAWQSELYLGGDDTYIHLVNPGFHPDVAKMAIQSATNRIVEQYTCNIHVTDKAGAGLNAVDVDCEYAHLVEGSDSKTYKCIQDHTAVDATHKPVTGTNWDEYWVLYNTVGGLGGPWQTGYAFKAAESLWPAVSTNGSGDISEQIIQYKKWLGTLEILEARIHKFTFSHASYPDFVMHDIIVDHPLVWEFDMGQSTSDLQTIVAGELATYDPPTRAELTTDKNSIITEIDANEAKIDTVDGVVDSVKAKTDNLPTDPADDSDIDAQLGAIAGYLDTEIAAIKAKTDNLPASPAPASEYDTEMARVTANVATEAKQNTAQSDLDKLTGADGATLATAQGNYAPAKAGDEMALSNDAITSAKYDESTAFPVSQKASQAASTIVSGAVVADGGNSTTQFKTNLTEATNDHYNGRVVLFVTGALTGQATDVTDYDGVNKILVVTPMTEIPAPTDVFVLV